VPGNRVALDALFLRVRRVREAPGYRCRQLGVAVVAARGWHLRWRGEGESGPTHDVRLDLLERCELVHDAFGGGRSDVAVDAPEVFVRTLFPCIVIRAHLVARRTELWSVRHHHRTE